MVNNLFLFRKNNSWNWAELVGYFSSSGSFLAPSGKRTFLCFDSILGIKSGPKAFSLICFI